MMPTVSRLALTLAAVACVLPLVLGLAGCCTTGGTGAAPPEDPEAKKRAELLRLESEEARLAAAADAIERGEFAFVTLGPAEIEAAARQSLPLSFSAASMNEHVSGTITISELKNARVVRGKLHFDLVGKGKNIAVSSLGQMALGQNKVAQYVRAVEGGMTVSVEGTVDAERGDLVFRGRAGKVTLIKEKGLATEVKNALNGSFFKKPHSIDLGALRLGSKQLAARMAMVSGGGVAILFAP